MTIITRLEVVRKEYLHKLAIREVNTVDVSKLQWGKKALKAYADVCLELGGASGTKHLIFALIKSLVAKLKEERVDVHAIKDSPLLFTCTIDHLTIYMLVLPKLTREQEAYETSISIYNSLSKGPGSILMKQTVSGGGVMFAGLITTNAYSSSM